MGILTIDKIVMNKTPNSGTWLFCFTVKQGDNSNTFNEPNVEHKGDGIEINMGLELADVEKGSKVEFDMGLDDDQADVCSPQAEDKCSGSWTVVNKGAVNKNPQGDWSFVIHYHWTA